MTPPETRAFDSIYYFRLFELPRVGNVKTPTRSSHRTDALAGCMAPRSAGRKAPDTRPDTKPSTATTTFRSAQPGRR